MWRFVVLLALAFVIPSTALADPVRIVNTGFLGTGGDDTGFWAEGPGFYFQTGAIFPFTGDPAVACNPCTPGTQLNLTSTVSVDGWQAGSARIDGQTFTNVYYSGLLSFYAGSVRIPDVPPQPEGLEETAIVPAFSAATFSGTLTGFADPSLTGTPLFSAQLVGSRIFTVTAGFGNVGSGVFLDYVDYYASENAAPTPEPGSLLLFGSGAAWVAARWRKRWQVAARS